MHSEGGRVGIFHEEMIQKKGLTEQVWRTESSDIGGSKRKSNWIFVKKGEATKSEFLPLCHSRSMDSFKTFQDQTHILVKSL